jgi:rhodanese-related sulfurtransferase
MTVPDLCLLLDTASPAAQPLLLDTRTSSLYAARHIESAISISLPKILLKRLQKSSPSSLNLEELVVCDKEALARRRTGCPVVVYDDGTDGDATSTTIVSVLRAEGLDPFLLQGVV